MYPEKMRAKSRISGPKRLAAIAALFVTGMISACGSSVDTTGTNGTTTAGDGLPCDVTQVLQSKCWACHGVKPIGGAPMSLATYDDLVAASKGNASKTNVQLSVERMQSTTAAMPPARAPAAP